MVLLESWSFLTGIWWFYVKTLETIETVKLFFESPSADFLSKSSGILVWTYCLTWEATSSVSSLKRDLLYDVLKLRWPCIWRTFLEFRSELAPVDGLWALKEIADFVLPNRVGLTEKSGNAWKFVVFWACSYTMFCSDPGLCCWVISSFTGIIVFLKASLYLSSCCLVSFLSKLNLPKIPLIWFSPHVFLLFMY